MLLYLPFLLILLFFVLLMLKSRVGMLQRLYDHPLTLAVPGVVMLYFAITDSQHRIVDILFVLLAAGLVWKQWRRWKVKTL
jgi:hypothetical protein